MGQYSFILLLIAVSVLNACGGSGSGSAAEGVDVTTMAGNGETGDVVGPGTTAEFNQPDGVTIAEENGADIAYMTDMGNNQVKKIDESGEVTVIAGSSAAGYADGTGADARFSGPTGITVDSTGNIYVADQGNDAIRKITPEGVVTTVVGSADSQGYADGPAATAKFSEPHGLAIDSSGDLYTTEWGNDTVRKIDMENGEAVTVSTLAGTGSAGDSEGDASQTSLDQPHGIAVNSAGEVFVADEMNNKIKKIDTVAEEVVTYAGTGEASFEDGDGSKAKFKQPRGLALGVYKNTDLYVCDYVNNRVRKVSVK